MSPSKYKALQKQAPQKVPLKNIRPGAYFRNFTVPGLFPLTAMCKRINHSRQCS